MVLLRSAWVAMSFWSAEDSSLSDGTFIWKSKNALLANESQVEADPSQSGPRALMRHGTRWDPACRDHRKFNQIISSQSVILFNGVIGQHIVFNAVDDLEKKINKFSISIHLFNLIELRQMCVQRCDACIFGVIFLCCSFIFEISESRFHFNHLQRQKFARQKRWLWIKIELIRNLFFKKLKIISALAVFVIFDKQPLTHNRIQ